VRFAFIRVFRARRSIRATIEDETLEALRESIRAVRTFHDSNDPRASATRSYPPALRPSARFRFPLDSVGVYCAGRPAPLPSSLVMGAVRPSRRRAQDRGRPRPKARSDSSSTARELGLDEINCVGCPRRLRRWLMEPRRSRRWNKIVGPRTD